MPKQHRPVGTRLGNRRFGRPSLWIVFSISLVLLTTLGLPVVTDHSVIEAQGWPHLDASAIQWPDFETLEEFGHSHDHIFTLVDEDGRIVTKTALSIGVGDSYIDGDNRLYGVVRIEDDLAHVRFREVVELPRVTAARPGGLWTTLLASLGQLAQQQDQERGPIGLYHSHNAESYEPTSGEDITEGKGDIHEVGSHLKEAFEGEGYEVVWLEDMHLPHDGGAYQRSRSTARELLEHEPVTMLDVHRDAIPAEEYRVEINGEEMTKIRLVVGRQNQNRDANLEYAKRIKSAADEAYPNLVKGIFNARGNYNQDIGPRMILLEFGTHETTLEEAQRSADLFAEILPAAAGMAPGTGAAAAQQLGTAAWRTALYLILVAVVAVIGYLWINTGSWQGVVQSLRKFVGREFAGAGAPTAEDQDDATSPPAGTNDQDDRDRP